MYRNGRTAFGDIVIAHREGLVVNSDIDNGAQGYDMQQEAFADVVINDYDEAEGYDMQQEAFAEISGGDDGLGMAQAQRLKQRIRGRKMRLGGAQIVRVGYDDDGLDNSLAGLSFKKMFKHPFGKKSLFGKATKFVGKNIVPLAAGGAAFLGAKKVITLFGRKRAPGTPVPAITPPTGPSVVEAPPTDVTGATLPMDMARTAGTTAAPSSPVGGASVAPTAMEQVAAAAEAAGGGQETGDATVSQAGMVGGGLGDMLSTPTGMALAAGAVLAIFFALKGKKGRRR